MVVCGCVWLCEDLCGCVRWCVSECDCVCVCACVPIQQLFNSSSTHICIYICVSLRNGVFVSTCGYVCLWVRIYVHT